MTPLRDLNSYLERQDEHPELGRVIPYVTLRLSINIRSMHHADLRARAETAMSRFKQVIGDSLRSHTTERRATEVGVAVHVLNCMLELGRPNSVRIA